MWCVAVCCNVLQCVHCVVVCCSVLWEKNGAYSFDALKLFYLRLHCLSVNVVYCSVLQCVAVCCSVC